LPRSQRRRRAPYDGPFQSPQVHPFDFKRLRALARASTPPRPQGRLIPNAPFPVTVAAPVVVAPVTLPSAPIAPAPAPVAKAKAKRAPKPTPEAVDCFGFTPSEIATLQGSDADWREANEQARLEDHDYRDAEAYRLGDIPKVIREDWIQRSKLPHYCATCKSDIPAGDSSKAVVVSQFSKISTLYYCFGCASGTDQGDNPNGCKLWEESSGEAICRVNGPGRAPKKGSE